MYTNTRFGELLKGLSRSRVERINRSHAGDKYSKGFDFWDHLVAMLFNQFSGARSLRELEASFNEQDVHHYHLGTRAIRRSTLADANSNRNPAAFAALLAELMPQVHRQLRRDLRELLYIIDSTPIPLYGSQFESWNQLHRTRTFVGLKLHLQMDLNRSLPVYASVSHANRPDVVEALEIPIEQGATYILDKGYCDYNWWHAIDQAGAFFVTRLKKNAAHKLVDHHAIPAADEASILEDTTMHLTNKRPRGGKQNHYARKDLRRVVVHREDKGTPLVLVTNDFKRSAAELAALYKARWAIELFFKWIKQNLKIKRFLGNSENAVKIQLYTAVIAYLLIALYRASNSIEVDLYRLVAAIRTSLFTRPKLEQSRYRREKRNRQILTQIQPEFAF